MNLMKTVADKKNRDKNIGDFFDDDTVTVLMMMTRMVSNEFRTDPKFSSVSPLDNFSQIIFASAHSFIMEKYHHLDEYHCHRSLNIFDCAVHILRIGDKKDCIYIEHFHRLIITHRHRCNVTILSIRKSLVGQ